MQIEAAVIHIKGATTCMLCQDDGHWLQAKLVLEGSQHVMQVSNTLVSLVTNHDQEE